MKRWISLVTMVVLAVAAFGFANPHESRAAVDDGYYDRWTVTSVGYTAGVDILVNYNRDWVHPASGLIVGDWSRTSPLPAVTLWHSTSALSGQTGTGSFVMGASSASITAPGTYLLRRDITLPDGTLTYRQDIVITLYATGSPTWTSTEELFVPDDVVPAEAPPAAPPPVLVVPGTPRTTG